MHHLPAGTVTLLFTDLEGSTQLLQQLGAQYAAVLEGSRRLLRTAFQKWQGHEVDTQGDAFFVVFSHAIDAISAAVEAQQAFAAYSWPEGAVVRVRIGLHTGEPSLVAEGYVGIDVHQAARTMSAGHGGQVLLSQVTTELVRPQLPAGVGLRDLGEHRLKNLQQPARLFQLEIANLPNDFPPLKALDLHHHNLPVQPTPLIGRAEEIAVVKQLLQRPDLRLVTLMGTGGIGKTRLALQIAADLSDQFKDGVCFVNLAPVSDPLLVLPTIAEVFGVREREEEAHSLEELLKEELHLKEILLLLDNFEQVVDAAAVVADLLEASHQLKILVTSRASLHIRAEHEFVVLPLTLPRIAQKPDVSVFLQSEAVALFVQRGQAVKADFQLTEANAPVVGEIVACLDGLPLAIELAAARLKLLSPENLLARLGQRLQLLTGGARDVAFRQQGLRNTIEWSYKLLQAPEQQLFRRLSIFVGGCTLEAVEAVCQAPELESLLDSLTTLIDSSLLQRQEQSPQEPRFAMLETLREYGLGALTASGERETLRRAHATYCLALAQRLVQGLWGANSGAFLEQLEQEHDNFRAAMQWSLEQPDRELALRLGVALRMFWSMHGYLSEGLDFLEQALQGSEDVEMAVRAGALHATARMNDFLGHNERAEVLIEESLELYQGLGDTERIAYGLHMQADMAWKKGALSLARSRAEEALALFRTLEDRSSIAGVLLHLGVLAGDQGMYTQAYELLEESLKINRELGDISDLADSLTNLARIGFFAASDRAQVHAYLDEGFAFHKTLDDKESIAYCLHLSGLLALEEGEISTARELVEQAVRLFREMKQSHGTILSTTGLARVLAAQSATQRARALYEESIALALKANDKLNVASSLEGLASVVAEQGEQCRAVRLWGCAEALREDLTAPMPLVDQPAYQRSVAAVRASMEDQLFAQNWAMGRAMTAGEVLR